MSLDVRQYRRREQHTVPAVQINKHNIKELEQFYRTTFKLGEYLILPDLDDDTPKLVRRRASVWSRAAFEETFAEVRTEEVRRGAPQY